MSIKTRLFRLFLTVNLGIICISGNAGLATDSVTLYTPYTKVTVPPGETINYTVDVINNTDEIETVDLTMSGYPRSWTFKMKSESLSIGQLSVLPHDKKSFSLTVEVPLKVNKGTYHFNLVAGGTTRLPLSVIISKQGTFKTEFTSQQTNMQGHSNSTYTYATILKNMTADVQNYALMADAPRGWTVTFKNKYQAVTSISVEPNAADNVVVEIKPPEEVETGTYKIPIRAITSTTSGELDLEAVVLGTYNLVVSTPMGLVSSTITAGESKKIELIVNNTGTSLLSDIKLKATIPDNWNLAFDPKTVISLLPGKTAQVFATIKASKKAIPGDYVTSIEARTPEVSSKVALRISVKTPMLWGWIGVLVIIIALGSVFYLFRRYGRR